MTSPWSAPMPPDKGVNSHEDYCACDTPIGRAMIEWKSWKDDPGYTLQIKGEWVGAFDSLDEAKAGLLERIKGVAFECTAWVAKHPD